MLEKQRILIVDDDENIAELISLYLTKECFDTRIANDGEAALAAVKSYMPGLVLLDIMLPGIDGYEVLREIRKSSSLPVIMLSAKGETFDKVLGLELGADDYITKPFSNRELLARIKSNLRRITNMPVEQPKDSKKELVIGTLRINPTHYAAYKNEKQLDLTHREFELLYYLAQHLGEVITRETLLETVWGYDYFGDVRTVDVTVRRLREKVEDTPSRPQYVSTRRGVGYYMSEPHE
ncbi:MAG TPA: DNA-binding response regulator [Lactococcus sp.]|nr:DNA-binding response regulator [Lactococcus sp.]